MLIQNHQNTKSLPFDFEFLALLSPYARHQRHSVAHLVAVRFPQCLQAKQPQVYGGRCMDACLASWNRHSRRETGTSVATIALSLQSHDRHLRFLSRKCSSTSDQKT